MKNRRASVRARTGHGWTFRAATLHQRSRAEEDLSDESTDEPPAHRPLSTQHDPGLSGPRRDRSANSADTYCQRANFACAAKLEVTLRDRTKLPWPILANLIMFLGLSSRFHATAVPKDRHQL